MDGTPPAQPATMGNLLWIIIIVLIILWLGGVSLSFGGNLIHILIVVALILLIYRLATGRKVLSRLLRPDEPALRQADGRSPNVGDLHLDVGTPFSIAGDVDGEAGAGRVVPRIELPDIGPRVQLRVVAARAVVDEHLHVTDPRRRERPASHPHCAAHLFVAPR